MKQIEQLTFKVKTNCDAGLFHNSREDCRLLGTALTRVMKKQSELIDRVNELTGTVEKLKLGGEPDGKEA